MKKRKQTSKNRKKFRKILYWILGIVLVGIFIFLIVKFNLFGSTSNIAFDAASPSASGLGAGGTN